MCVIKRRKPKKNIYIYKWMRKFINNNDAFRPYEWSYLRYINYENFNRKVFYVIFRVGIIKLKQWFKWYRKIFEKYSKKMPPWNINYTTFTSSDNQTDISILLPSRYTDPICPQDFSFFFTLFLFPFPLLLSFFLTSSTYFFFLSFSTNTNWLFL